MHKDWRGVAELYGLGEHPEGGYFRETYRAEGVIPGTGRNFSTAVYYLLAAGQRSRLHRLKSDELWHFYLGGPLAVEQLFPDGRTETVLLGQDAAAGQRLQHAVPAGCWFGAWPAEGTAFSLVGCTVAPGFDFADFELGDRERLLKAFPGAADLIRKLA